MKIYHKFKAEKSEADGIKFPSKKERDYYLSLVESQKEGRLAFFLRQVPFHMPGNIRYVIDFIEFWRTDNPEIHEIVFTEVKGFKTKEYKIKKKIIEDLFPVEINEV